jgi:hypothetical protein
LTILGFRLASGGVQDRVLVLRVFASQTRDVDLLGLR